MKITFEILEYMLTNGALLGEESAPVILSSQIGTPGAEILHIRLLVPGEALRPDTLYLLEAAQMPRLAAPLPPASVRLQAPCTSRKVQSPPMSRAARPGTASDRRLPSAPRPEKTKSRRVRVWEAGS